MSILISNQYPETIAVPTTGNGVARVGPGLECNICTVEITKYIIWEQKIFGSHDSDCNTTNTIFGDICKKEIFGYLGSIERKKSKLRAKTKACCENEKNNGKKLNQIKSNQINQSINQNLGQRMRVQRKETFWLQ